MKKLNYFFVGIMILILILPEIVGCCYAIPSADDFSNAIGWISYEGNHFVYLYEHMCDIYISWQGTYLGDYLAGLPIFYLFGFVGLRICCLLSVITFFVSISLCIIAIMEYLGFDTKKNIISAMVIVGFGLFYLLGASELSEVFYWYTAICVYTLPLCFALIAISCYLFNAKHKKRSILIIGTFFAVMASGGALDIAAFSCSVFLMVIVYDTVISKKIEPNAIMGLGALLGAIVNAFAPGNFTRHSAIDSELRIMPSLINAVSYGTEVIVDEMNDGIILCIICFSFLWGYFRYNKNEFEFRVPGVLTLYGIIALIIVDFPVILGYSQAYLPSRCQFVERVTIWTYALFISLFWGAWCSKKKVFSLTNTSILIIALVCVLQVIDYAKFDNFISLTPYRMTYHILNGDFSNISEREEAVIDEIMNSDCSDVVVERQHNLEDEWSNIKLIELQEDSTDWVNGAVARYFGKSSITIKYTD